MAPGTETRVRIPPGVAVEAERGEVAGLTAPDARGQRHDWGRGRLGRLAVHVQPMQRVGDDGERGDLAGGGAHVPRPRVDQGPGRRLAERFEQPVVAEVPQGGRAGHRGVVEPAARVGLVPGGHRFRFELDGQPIGDLSEQRRTGPGRVEHDGEDLVLLRQFPGSPGDPVGALPVLDDLEVRDAVGAVSGDADDAPAAVPGDTPGQDEPADHRGFRVGALHPGGQRNLRRHQVRHPLAEAFGAEDRFGSVFIAERSAPTVMPWG
jgi:hypothetical protein